MADKIISMGSMKNFHQYDDTEFGGIVVESGANDGVVFGIDPIGADWLNNAVVTIYKTLQLISALTNSEVLRFEVIPGVKIRITSAVSGSASTVPIEILATAELWLNTSGAGVGIDNSSPSSALDVSGDIEVGSANAFYFGDPTTDTSWRIVRSGDDLLFQQREAGVWNTKQTMSGA